MHHTGAHRTRGRRFPLTDHHVISTYESISREVASYKMQSWAYHWLPHRTILITRLKAVAFKLSYSVVSAHSEKHAVLRQMHFVNVITTVSKWNTWHQKIRLLSSNGVVNPGAHILQRCIMLHGGVKKEFIVDPVTLFCTRMFHVLQRFTAPLLCFGLCRFTAWNRST